MDHLKSSADDLPEKDNFFCDFLDGLQNRFKSRFLHTITPPVTEDEILCSSVDPGDPYLNDVQESILAMEEDEALRQLYRDVILDKNPMALQKKTKKQLRALEKIKRTGALKPFQDFMQKGCVISSGHDSGIQQLLAPIHTGKQSHGGFLLDQLFRAQNYVYAGLSTLPHLMAGGVSGSLDIDKSSLKRSGRTVLLETGLDQRAEIVMTDVSDIRHFVGDHGVSFVKHYLDNMFDYEGGKELLALYL